MPKVHCSSAGNCLGPGWCASPTLSKSREKSIKNHQTVLCEPNILHPADVFKVKQDLPSWRPDRRCASLPAPDGQNQNLTTVKQSAKVAPKHAKIPDASHTDQPSHTNIPKERPGVHMARSQKSPTWPNRRKVQKHTPRKPGLQEWSSQSHAAVKHVTGHHHS